MLESRSKYYSFRFVFMNNTENNYYQNDNDDLAKNDDKIYAI